MLWEDMELQVVSEGSVCMYKGYGRESSEVPSSYASAWPGREPGGRAC